MKRKHFSIQNSRNSIETIFIFSARHTWPTNSTGSTDSTAECCDGATIAEFNIGHIESFKWYSKILQKFLFNCQLINNLNLNLISFHTVGTSNALVQSVQNTNGIQTMANAQDSQPITITNAQGQQITVIPTQAIQQLRPNANIIQMQNMSGLQAIPVQNIPGLGNVQVNWHNFDCYNKCRCRYSLEFSH